MMIKIQPMVSMLLKIAKMIVRGIPASVLRSSVGRCWHPDPAELSSAFVNDFVRRHAPCVSLEWVVTSGNLPLVQVGTAICTVASDPLSRQMCWSRNQRSISPNGRRQAETGR